ncbi:RNA polymerase sigma factor [Thermomicrobium sp. 4228-Ro]|uniref:RNA polymerase sigma factor n=1 Tax=Thermomicrobium sp. 4228-Ro TaxID=2993937 RepID=UPI002248AEEB|nr:RNA polymerase sigma factor [Thermomicrobium sp. 4228-Ro]MCX2728396.1 RNA polymerase sigma factor [Thermomicrobium sp. 4228-Ro]
MARMQQGSRTDDELVQRFRAGDSQAFATLYERYVDRIYDFVVRLIGDRDAAADITQETFLKAMQALRARRFSGSLRAWLFTIARNAAIDYQRRQRTTAFSHLPTPEGEEWEPEIPASGPEAEPEETTRRRELAELVWQAARGLPPNDYAVLELALRHDLTPAEVAQVVGVRRGAINTRLSRVRDALEESFTVLLLARRSRQNCPELARLLEGTSLPEGLTPELRRAVARHVEHCETCQRARRAISAADLLPALAPVLPTGEMREAIRQAIEQGLAAPTAAPVGVVRLRDWIRHSSWAKAALAAVGGLVVVTVVGWGYLTWGTAPVAVQTVGCPPLALRLDPPAAVAGRLLGVPSVLEPGRPATFRLPAGTLRATVGKGEATLQVAGLGVHLRILADLADVTWDGRKLLGQGTVTVALDRGSPSAVTLVCRPTA